MNLLLAALLWATVVFPSGNIYTVELATTPAQWTKGLSGRSSLAPNRGMLFVFPQPHVQYFWMKGMKFPIDIIWLDENYTVLGAVENAPPCKAHCPTYNSRVPAKYVLEVPAGTVKKEELKSGDRLIVQYTNQGVN